MLMTMQLDVRFCSLFIQLLRMGNKQPGQKEQQEINQPYLNKRTESEVKNPYINNSQTHTLVRIIIRKDKEQSVSMAYLTDTLATIRQRIHLTSNIYFYYSQFIIHPSFEPSVSLNYVLQQINNTPVLTAKTTITKSDPFLDYINHQDQDKINRLSIQRVPFIPENFILLVKGDKVDPTTSTLVSINYNSTLDAMRILLRLGSFYRFQEIQEGNQSKKKPTTFTIEKQSQQKIQVSSLLFRSRLPYPTIIVKAIIPKIKNYQGELNVDGLKQGFGKLKEKNMEYIGNWKDDVFDGYGKLKEKNYSYQGNWKGGLMHGYGVLDMKNEERYQGQFAYGKKNGKGVSVLQNGYSYIGQWKQNEMDGRFIESDQQGNQKRTYFKNGQIKSPFLCGFWPC